jgi:hypothetical protein
VRTGVAAACALLVLAGCGAPPTVHTIDGEPDLASIVAAIPPGFHDAVGVELQRLQSACAEIDHQVGISQPPPARFPLRFELVDAQCEWFRATGDGRPGPPEVIIGLLVSAGGGATLDQTVAILDHERSVENVGDRAVFDPQTHTLYVVTADRLWYLQLVGPQPADPLTGLVHLGRALVRSAPAR